MDDTTKQKYLEEHIPYRMRFIEMLRIACELLLSSQRPAKVEVMFDGRSVLSADSVYFITNPFLEVGTLYSRVMLEFLGLKMTKRRAL